LDEPLPKVRNMQRRRGHFAGKGRKTVQCRRTKGKLARIGQLKGEERTSKSGWGSICRSSDGRRGKNAACGWEAATGMPKLREISRNGCWACESLLLLGCGRRPRRPWLCPVAANLRENEKLVPSLVLCSSLHSSSTHAIFNIRASRVPAGRPRGG
jgi:hypothetical protein